MRLAWRNLKNDRLRFAATVVGIAFATFLMVFQGDLFTGFLHSASNVIDAADADIWIVPRKVNCFQYGAPLPKRFRDLAFGVPGVQSVTNVLSGWVTYQTPSGSQRIVFVIGGDRDMGSKIPLPYVNGYSGPLLSEKLVIASEATPRAQVVLAAPGRIEGLTEVVDIGAGVDGVVAEIPVKEGKWVEAGTVIARIDRPDLQADVRTANEALESARQSQIRVVRGSRDEERREAEAKRMAAEASYQQAQLQYQRNDALFKQGIVSHEVWEQYKRDFDLAAANLRAVQESEKLIKAGPLPEEVARADAEVRRAEAAAKSANAQLDMCLIKARISGTILRVYMKPGESFSAQFPRPILSMADTSALRVRVEVDERDIGHVFPGQAAFVVADAFPGQRLTGKVARIGPLMGRKKVRTGDPAEKSDRDVLETLVDLDKSELPLA